MLCFVTDFFHLKFSEVIFVIACSITSLFYCQIMFYWVDILHFVYFLSVDRPLSYFHFLLLQIILQWTYVWWFCVDVGFNFFEICVYVCVSMTNYLVLEKEFFQICPAFYMVKKSILFSIFVYVYVLLLIYVWVCI